jgi:SRSO17 transposase
VSKSIRCRFNYAKRRPASARKPVMQLGPSDVDALSDELVRYHARFHSVFQRREQRLWSMFYLCGQLSDLERKTIEPMVLGLQSTRPSDVRAVQQFIGQGQWSAEALLVRHQAVVAESLGHAQGVVIVDGSAFPKQCDDSVGVAPQYCGCLGKIANCQEGVFLVYASPHGCTFLDSRLYLPAEWFEAHHRERWDKCAVPKSILFQTEPQLALAMLADLVKRAVLPFQWVTCDEHFGENPAFLDGIADLGKCYVAEVPCNTRVWLRTPRVEPPGPSPLGRPRTRPRVAPHAPRPHALRELANELPRASWIRYTFKQGSRGPMQAEFAFVRVTTLRSRLPGPRVWAVLRRKTDAPTEMKFYLSNASANCAPRELVPLVGLRWPIETALEEAKGEVGMDHYETRTWRGWHHHMAQTFLAHHFLIQLRHTLKKSARAHHGSSPPVNCLCAGRRRATARSDFRADQLSPTTQPHCLSLTSQADDPAESQCLKLAIHEVS